MIPVRPSRLVKVAEVDGGWTGICELFQVAEPNSAVVLAVARSIDCRPAAAPDFFEVFVAAGQGAEFGREIHGQRAVPAARSKARPANSGLRRPVRRAGKEGVPAGIGDQVSRDKQALPRQVAARLARRFMFRSPVRPRAWP